VTSTLDLLTGPEAEGILAAAVSALGGELRSCRAGQVDHRPGRGSTVAYDAQVDWPEHGVRHEVIAASAGLPTDPTSPGVVVVSDGELDVAVWCFPNDPDLPALASAQDAGAVVALLRDLGAPVEEGAAVELLVRSYRPRRRAVVEVRVTGEGDLTRALFLKVCRPEAIERVHGRHVLLRDAGVPVPQSWGWTASGLLLLAALTGESLRSAVCRDGVAAVDVDDLVGVLDRLPRALVDLPRRRSWTDGVRHYAGVLTAAVPDEARRIAALADGIEERSRTDEPVVATHGDFYEAQLLVSGGRLSGVLDVDTAGPGRRSDDLACALAHIEVLAQIADRSGDPEGARVLGEVTETWLERFDRDPLVEPRSLRARTAGVLFSLATGPQRVQETGWPETTSARLDLVERWVARA
jgi:hypothetical protein